MSNAKKLYKREVYKTKSDWLEHRGFGGSSASAILGKNPWQNILELYKSIVMKIPKKVNDANEALQYGTRCEDLIRRMFALDFQDKYKVFAPNNREMYRRKDKPYLTATLDGRIIDINDHSKKLILEIKTHDIRNRKDDEYWKGAIPDNYFIQCLHYLMVMNDYDGVILVAKLRYFDYYHEGGKKLLRQELRYYFIDREEVKDQLVYLEQKETDFWENNIQKKVMPKLSISL